jgi:hypothetical protein
VDVRDLEINLRGLLQSSQIAAFYKREAQEGEASESVDLEEGGTTVALD